MTAATSTPRDHARVPMPPVVDLTEWDRARATLLDREKAHTRAGDAIAAQRRRLPMVPVTQEYALVGAGGTASLLDLFEGRRQLLLYFHMLRPDDESPCAGCCAFCDGVGRLEQLHVHDATFAAVADAPYDQFEALRQRMEWRFPVYSSAGTTLREDWNRNPWNPGSFGLAAFLRDGRDVFLTYFTQGRGVEGAAGLGLLDLLPYGRQEAFEDSPEGWPQSPTYAFGRLHDEYTADELDGTRMPSSSGTPIGG